MRDKLSEDLNSAFLLLSDKLLESANDLRQESREAADDAQVLGTSTGVGNNSPAPLAREQEPTERGSPASISISGEIAPSPICQYNL